MHRNRAGKADTIVFLVICIFFIIWGGFDIPQSLLEGGTSAPMSGREVSFNEAPIIFLIIVFFKATIFLYCLYYVYQWFMLRVDRWRTSRKNQARRGRSSK